MNILTNHKTMLAKVTEILSSVRFWQAVGVGILVWLQSNDWKQGAITTLSISLGIGTLDKVASKLR